MAKCLESSIGIHGKGSLTIEHPVKDVLPCCPSFCEAEVLHQYEFGWGKAVVHLC